MDVKWRKHALCNNTDPDLYDLDYVEGKLGITSYVQQQEYAQQMCAGCPVVRECALEALDIIDVADYACTPDGFSGQCFTEGVVRAGLALGSGDANCRTRGRRRVCGVAGIVWEALGPYRPRRFVSCVGCGLGFADGGGWGVGRASARLCVFCSGRRQAAA